MDRKGSVLMIGLWVIAMLSVFALGLGHRAAINLKLARYQRDKLKAVYLARSGINRALALINEDELDPDAQKYDTLKECGVVLKDRDPKTLFAREFAVNEGFVVGYRSPQGDFVYGLSDENARININIVNDVTGFEKRKMVALLKNTADPEGLSDALLNWINPASEEDKKEGLAVPEEFILPAEKFFRPKFSTKEQAAKEASRIYKEIKDLFTVYGEDNNKSTININTASQEVLRIMCVAVAGDEAVGNSLATKLALVIENENNPIIDITAISGLNLVGNEPNIFTELQKHLTVKSSFLRIESTGYVGEIKHCITAVYDRSAKVYYWHEN